MPPAKRRGVARSRVVWCMPCIVGAACMRPAAGCLMYRFCAVTAFGPCVGAAYMPPAKTPRRCPFTGCMVFALQNRVNGHISHKPRVVANPCRAAYMPPLQIRVPRTQTQKHHHRTNAHGPHTCGPYEPAGNGRYMGRAGVYRRTPTAGSRPRPTERRKRSVYPQTPRGATPCRAAYMRPLQTSWKRQVNGQSRHLPQHGRNTQKPDTNCTFVQCWISPGAGPKLHAAPCKMPCRRARRRLHKNFFGRPP